MKCNEFGRPKIRCVNRFEKEEIDCGEKCVIVWKLDEEIAKNYCGCNSGGCFGGCKSCMGGGCASGSCGPVGCSDAGCATGIATPVSPVPPLAPTAPTTTILPMDPPIYSNSATAQPLPPLQPQTRQYLEGVYAPSLAPATTKSLPPVTPRQATRPATIR